MGPHLQPRERPRDGADGGENTAHATTTMRNTGTTAIWYKWWVPPKAAELPHASNAGPSTFFMEETPGRCSRANRASPCGRSSLEKPGVYIDKWILETTPNVRAGRIEPITVRGIYHAGRPNSYPRRMLAAEIAHREMRTKVTAAMAKVFDRVKTPDVMSKRVATKMSPVPRSGPAPAPWNAGNAGRRPRVYYHEESFEAFMDVRRRCIAAEKTLPPEPKEEEEEEEEGGRRRASDAGGGPRRMPPPRRTNRSSSCRSEGWDGSVGRAEDASEASRLPSSARRRWTPPRAPAAEGAEKAVCRRRRPGAMPRQPTPPRSPTRMPRRVPPARGGARDRAARVSRRRCASRSCPGREPISAAALSEAVTRRLGSVDERFEKARAKQRPPSPPPPEVAREGATDPRRRPAGRERRRNRARARNRAQCRGEKKDQGAFEQRGESAARC